MMRTETQSMFFKSLANNTKITLTVLQIY